MDVACKFMLPAFPCPEVLVLIRAPSDNNKSPVLISTVPLFPTAFSTTLLKMLLLDNSTESVAKIDTKPAFPSPKIAD
jgi:hypothetical protein